MQMHVRDKLYIISHPPKEKIALHIETKVAVFKQTLILMVFKMMKIVDHLITR